jgi:hypothetical protein
MDNSAPDGKARAATTPATASMNTATRNAPLITASRAGHAPGKPLMDASTRGAYGEGAAREHHPLAPRLSLGRPVHAGRSGIVVAVGPLAQLVAHLHDAQGVVGSSPARPTQNCLVTTYFSPSEVHGHLSTARTTISREGLMGLFGFWRGAASKLTIRCRWQRNHGTPVVKPIGRESDFSPGRSSAAPALSAGNRTRAVNGEPPQPLQCRRRAGHSRCGHGRS